MGTIEQNILKEVAGLDALPVGAYNIRTNGTSSARNTTANIDIVTKEDKPGIDIIIKPGTKNESVHIPVVVSQAGLKDMVYNDFFVGEGADVTIVAGCGIHNCGSADSGHDGIHTFYVEKGAGCASLKSGAARRSGTGRHLATIVHLKEDAEMIMETSQISGIDDTLRITEADLCDRAKLEIHDSIMTTGDQNADAQFTADLNGEDCACNIVSRTVARDHSKQHYTSTLNGNNRCAGHTECDSILMDQAYVLATPQLSAATTEASLIHEAAIGKIAGEQLIKLMTLGLTEEEAEEQIISGFLK